MISCRRMLLWLRWAPAWGPVSRRAFGLLLVGLLLTCSEGGRPKDRVPQVADLAPLSDVSEHLRAIGYVTWDEDADRDVSGVTWHSKERAAPGLNLFTNDVDRVLLMDSEGLVLRQWELPGRRQCEHVELIKGLRLAVVCEGEALIVLEPGGEVVLEFAGRVHHDIAPLADGRMLVPIVEPPTFYRGRHVVFNALLEISMDGGTREVWKGSSAVARLRDLHGPTELDGWPPFSSIVRHAYRRFRGRGVSTYEYYHLNSVEVIGDNALGRQDPRFRPGNILLGLRNAHTAVILDAETWQPVWHWGEDDLDMPHMPTILASGNFLVFDNGMRRRWTRVVELDPREDRIVWQYPKVADPDFFSAERGSSQRLPNGNTLICLSDEGHVVEVDPQGELVWEFWNPNITERGRKRIYRFQRLTPDASERLLQASAGHALPD